MSKIRLRIIVTSLLSIVLVCILFVGNTLSIESIREVDENLNYYSTANLDISYSISSKEVVLNNSYPISYDEAVKLKPIRVVIYNNGNVGYKFNLILNDKTSVNKINYKYINVKIGNEDYFSLDNVSDNIIKKDIYVDANSSVNVDIFIWLDENTPNSEIGHGFYATLSIDGFAISDLELVNKNYVYNLDVSGANKPNIINGMIPVYYDYTSYNWKKADINNIDNNYKWYDYGSKMWANGVLVSKESYDKYNNGNNGMIIDNKDMIAFYVWIPRFKYKVININRSKINNYGSYIPVIFESGVNKSTNISCKYNYQDSNDEVLADECIVNSNKIIINSDNSIYNNVWYTHPAFTYDDKEIEGFWIGKFETTGSVGKPTILPDNVSLREVSIFDAIASNKLFNNYVSDEIDTRIIRNIEWGSVAYLSNSIYGLCNKLNDDVVCNNNYNNNSSDYYTGSGGISNSVNRYGTYNYQGYLIDSLSTDRKVLFDKKSDIIASSTLNIYGVYDLKGGAKEMVMGVNHNLNIERKYYDLYNNVSSSTDIYNSILGDGTVEYGTLDNNFINRDDYLFIRGNLYDENGNIFKYSACNGDKNNKYTFRSVIS